MRPGKTVSRYSLSGNPSRLQDSTIDRIAATFGPAVALKAGPKVAAILSVVESCRRISVPVKEYLAGVLPGLDRRRLGEVATLTPARWNASRT